MTLAEFRKAILATKNAKWFNSTKIRIEHSYLDIEFDFEGLSSLYKYANEQYELWDEINNLPYELQESKKYFKTILLDLERFVVANKDTEEDHSLEYNFNSNKSFIQSGAKKVFPADSIAIKFLLDVKENYPAKFAGVYGYLSKSLSNIREKDIFDGYLMAYEFQSKANSEIFQRKNKEKASITKLTTDFKNSLPILEKELTDHLKNSTDKYEEYVKVIDDFKVDKEETYFDWFINTKGNFEIFSKTSDERIKELEYAYNEKLKLEEPAKYWATRGRKLKKQGWIALTVLIVLVLIVVITLGELLWKVPEQIFNSFFDGDKSAAIRWSIIYITFISFMAFCIKAVSKVMFSSFHLARDSEERYTLTYFYLSLLKDAEVSKEEKQLIMQSLFSRADTGLLKEDSSPTMPNDITSKLFGGK